MEDEDEDHQPYMSGRQVPLRGDEAIKILREISPDKCIQTMTSNPKGGSVYLLNTGHADQRDSWKQDGYRWKHNGALHFPQNKQSEIYKRMFVLLNADGTIGDVRKHVYCWDIGVQKNDLVLIHYIGHLHNGDMEAVEDRTVVPCPNQVTPSQVDKTSSFVESPGDCHMEQQDVHEADTTTSRIPAPSLTLYIEPLDTTTQTQIQPDTTTMDTMEVSNPEPTSSTDMPAQIPARVPDTAVCTGDPPPQIPASVPDTVVPTPDLDRAMKTVRDALLAKTGGTTPVMEVFNKLLESVVEKDGNSELDYCLVVSDKKSGQSSLIGTDEAKARLSNTQSNIGSKRRIIGGPATYGDADDDGEPPVKKAKSTPVKASLEENEVMSSCGEIVQLPRPSSEVYFGYSIISQEEKSIHADFFTHKIKGSTKTPERYLKIRNYIIESWQRQKPVYINANQARKGLAGCGDVLVISRIHNYLQCKGVVNFNAEKTSRWASTSITICSPTTSKPQLEDESENEMDDGSIMDDTIDNKEDSDLDYSPREIKRSTRTKSIANTPTVSKNLSKFVTNFPTTSNKTPRSSKSSSQSDRVRSSSQSDRVRSSSRLSEAKSVITKATSKQVEGHLDSEKENQLTKKNNSRKETHSEVKSSPITRAVISKSNIKVKEIVTRTLKGQNTTIQNESLKCNMKTPVITSRSEQKVTVRSSGRRSRNTAAPNWADILSGRKSFREEGGLLNSPKGNKNEDENVGKNLPMKAKSPKTTNNESSQIKPFVKVINKTSKENVVGTKSKKNEKTTSPAKAYVKVIKKTRTQESVEQSESNKDNDGKEIEQNSIVIQNSSFHDVTKQIEKSQEAEDHVINQGHIEVNDNNMDTETAAADVKSHTVSTLKDDLKVSKNILKPNTGDKSELKANKLNNDIEIIEWTGTGNLYRVRSKGNRHMAFELKEIDNLSKPFEANAPLGRGARSRNAYKYVCDICDKRFSVEYLFEEHAKTHGIKAETVENITDEIEKLEQDLQTDMSETNKINSSDGLRLAGDVKEEIVDLDNEIEDEDLDYVLDKVAEREEEAADDSDEYQREDDGNNDEEYDYEMDRKKQRKGMQLKQEILKNSFTDGKPTCKECGTVFLSQANLNRHNLLHTNYVYECPFCTKIMKRKDYVLAHIRKCHKEVDLVNDPVDFSKYTHKMSDIKKDEVKVNTETIEKGETVDEKDVKSEILKMDPGKSICPECTKMFNSRDDLGEHMLLVHEKELKDALYTCPACKMQFKTQISLQVHKLSHRKKEHECIYCNQIFKTNSQLQVHKRHDHSIQYGTLMYFGYLMSKGRIVCEICSSEYDSMTEYHEHRPDHLTLEYMCCECGNGFRSEAELEYHKESQCSEIYLHLPCGICDSKFSMYDARRKHILANHPKTTDFFCHHCGKCFDNMEMLREHFGLHKEEKIYECEYCEKRFFEKRNLVDHRHLHRSSKNFKCNICSRLYISTKSLQRHIKLHVKEKPCRYCDSKFKTKEELDQHIDEVHSNSSDKTGHNCDLCTRSFTTRRRLIMHMQKHNEDSTPDTLYECQVCNNMFDTKVTPLWKHMKAEHPEDLKKLKSKKELICETCGFTTIHKQRLARHLEVHNTEKKFQCTICSKKFQTTSSYMTHMIIHRGKIKPGVAQHTNCRWQRCKKKFMKPSNMKRHLLSHVFKVKIGKDPCDCKNCPMVRTDIVGEYVILDNRKSVEGTGGGNMQNGGSRPENISVVLTAGGAIQGYESMDVLQEAIAQIEDIEKNTSTDTGNAVIGKVVGNGFGSTENDATGGDVMNDMQVTQEGEICGEVGADLNDADGVSVNGEGFDENESLLLDSGMTNLQVDQATQMTQGAEISGEMEPEKEWLGYECSICDLVFQTKCQVLYHTEEEHVDSKFPMCEICNRYFIDQKNLGYHMSVHTGDKSFICEICKKTFRTKQCLRQHTFIHAEVKPFICSYCGHGFTQRGFFEEHVRRHTGVKPFECVICNKGFVSKNILKSHMYSHTGDKPHQCTYCHKSFTENYSLVAHLRTHNDDRPFKCTECEKAFFVKPKLIRHMTTVHSIDKGHLSNFEPTKIGSGIGYRDKTKLKNYIPQNIKPSSARKTQVVYVDAQGNIISQVMRSEEEIQAEKEQLIKIKKFQQQQQQQKQFVLVNRQGSETNLAAGGSGIESFEVVTSRDPTGVVQVSGIIPQGDTDGMEAVHMMDDGETIEAFEVVTNTRDNGDIQINTVGANSDHVIIENSDGEQTFVSMENNNENVVYQSLQTIENDGSIDIGGQNYTFVTHSNQQGEESHLELITQALAGVQASSEIDHSQIEVITEDSIDHEEIRENGNIDIYEKAGIDESEVLEGTENFSINIGEDGTVDAADFEKIEALSNMYNDQPIVIVLESQQNEEGMES